MKNIRYVSKSGICAGIGKQCEDDPYFGNSTLRQQMWSDDGPRGILWSHDGKPCAAMFQGLIRAEVISGLDCIVVTMNCDNRFPAPDNGVVLNPDGSLRFQILAPLTITSSHDRWGRSWTPTHLGDARVEQDGVVMRVHYYDGERFEDRKFDVKTGEWGSVVGTGRN